MAIGDGSNDLSLLQSVGLGIAMGNAVPEVISSSQMCVYSPVQSWHKDMGHAVSFHF